MINIFIVTIYLIIIIAVVGLAGDGEGDGLDVHGTHPEEPLPCENYHHVPWHYHYCHYHITIIIKSIIHILSLLLNLR